MTEKDLLFGIKDGVGTITINRAPQRNAISASAIELFHTYLDEAEKNEDVKVICVTGYGDKAFCSGADLSGVMGKGIEEETRAFQNYADLLIKLSKYPKPTVAKINGYCLAGGTGFMLACDIVIARSDAKFGTPEVNVGLFPLMIGALIFRNVLKKKAMEMILLGEKLSADQALEMGLITRVVQPDKLDGEVNGVLKSLTEKSPIAMKLGKEAFDRASEMGFDEGVKHLSNTLSKVIKTDDAREGITAFIEKRKPEFKGK
jgi:enoyl-CoA hydratase/carnithine racemase